MINKLRQSSHFCLSVLYCSGVVLSLAAIYSAIATAITVGYSTDDPNIKPGMVVKADPSSEGQKVSSASSEDNGNIIGVVTTLDASTLTLASSSQSVFVQTEGQVSAYVSDLNGEVKAGDLLTISPLRGVLVKVDTPGVAVYATALEDFPSQQQDLEVKDANDRSMTVKTALMSINFTNKGIVANPDTDSELRQLGRSVLGKDVSELQIIAAFIVFVVVIVAEAAILYAAVSNALSSIGRNPFAKEQIRRELFRVIAMAVAILVIGLAVVYGILSL